MGMAADVFGWQEAVAISLNPTLEIESEGPFDPQAEKAWTEHAVREIKILLGDLDIPTRLSALGVTKADIPELVRLSQGSSLSGNPKPITEAELAALLESML
jgi:alcohol dehydrogenase class IV